MNTIPLRRFSSMEGTLSQVLAPASRPTLQIYRALLIFLLLIGTILFFVSTRIVEVAPVVIDDSARQDVFAPEDGKITRMETDYRCAMGRPLLVLTNADLDASIAETRAEVERDRAEVNDWKQLIDGWTWGNSYVDSMSLKTDAVTTAQRLLEAKLLSQSTVKVGVIFFTERRAWLRAQAEAQITLEEARQRFRVLQAKENACVICSAVTGRIVWAENVHPGINVRAGDRLGLVEPLEAHRSLCHLSWEAARRILTQRECRISLSHAVGPSVPAHIVGFVARVDGSVQVTLESVYALSTSNVYAASFQVGQAPLWKVLFTNFSPANPTEKP